MNYHRVNRRNARPPIGAPGGGCRAMCAGLTMKQVLSNSRTLNAYA
jgi:hypothetical protein